MQRAIHVLPGDHQDWIVREDRGRELGHYPSKQAAEIVGRKLATKRKVEVVIYGPGGTVQKRSRPRKGIFAKLFGR